MATTTAVFSNRMLVNSACVLAHVVNFLRRRCDKLSKWKFYISTTAYRMKRERWTEKNLIFRLFPFSECGGKAARVLICLPIRSLVYLSTRNLESRLIIIWDVFDLLYRIRMLQITCFLYFFELFVKSPSNHNNLLGFLHFSGQS